MLTWDDGSSLGVRVVRRQDEADASASNTGGSWMGSTRVVSEATHER